MTGNRSFTFIKPVDPDGIGTRGRLPVMRERGFTLIELLVVIAIISLLVALLMPSLQQAKQRALAVNCMMNLRGLGQAMEMYAGETEYYPGGHTWAGIAAWIVWPSRLRVYTGGTEMFYCPVAEPESRWQAKFGSGLPAGYGYAAGEVRLVPWDRFSYGYNNWGSADFVQPQVGLGGLVDYPGNPPPDWNELKASRVVAPADMIAIGDSTVVHCWDAFIDPQPGEPLEWPSDRHYGNTQLVFCDTHVERLPRDRHHVIGTAPQVTRRWNNDNRPH